MLEIANYTILALAILVLVGGIIGFKKAQSRASLIAGLVSFVLLTASYLYASSNHANTKPGLIAGDAIALLLTIMFFFRYSKGRKFMPSGLMIILCMLAVVVVTMAILGG